ncbi:MAG: hypothetical protein ACKN8Y_03715, partial [Polynucleobacter victoriensis]
MIKLEVSKRPIQLMLNVHRDNIANFAKLMLALALLIGIIVVAAQDLAPNISYAKLFAYVFFGLAALAINLVGLSVIYLNVYQWVLRKGGTDTAWFWFSSEPKGL